MIAVGLATEPLIVVPLAVGIGAFFWGRRATGRDAHSPAVPKHACRGPATGRLRRRLAPALVVPVVGLGLLLATGDDLPLSRSERTLLLLVAGVVVAAGVLVRRLRPLAVATGSVVLLAALPWSGMGGAVPLVLVAAALLGTLLTDDVSRGPVEARPHPLLRAAVAIPVLVLTLVGALFAPATAPRPPVAQLAAWINGPASGGSAVAVPAELWGDLLRNGVPAERLHLIGSGSGADAVWTVDVGDPAPDTHLSAALGSGATVITVQQTARAHE
jgi:putative peptide zinc metalloprotease protein